MGPTITNITSSLDMMNSPNPCTSEEKSERSAEAQKTEEEVPQLHPPEELGCQMPSTSSGDDHRIISPMDRHLYEEKRNE